MRPNLITLSAAAVAFTLLGGVALAQNVEQVNVEAKRAMSTKVVGRTSSGLPVADITLTYVVSTKGLDLASSAGGTELIERVRDAARGACQEIGRQHPNAAPSDAECARVANEQAMARARQLIARAKGDVHRE
jgi:UrcA family protein